MSFLDEEPFEEARKSHDSLLQPHLLYWNWMWGSRQRGTGTLRLFWTVVLVASALFVGARLNLFCTALDLNFGSLNPHRGLSFDAEIFDDCNSGSNAGIYAYLWQNIKININWQLKFSW